MDSEEQEKLPNHRGSDRVTIKIPRPLYKKLAKVIEGSGYNSVTDFVVYVLRDLAASHEIAAGKEKISEGAQVVDGTGGDEIERVKQRLRALGYM